jgi:hypothetical protein
MSGSLSPAHYEIRIDGVLDKRWTAWFDGLQVKSEGSQTIISGPLTDQPALHGVLVKVRDLGLCLISVRRLDPGDAGRTTPPGGHHASGDAGPVRRRAHDRQGR